MAETVSGKSELQNQAMDTVRVNKPIGCDINETKEIPEIVLQESLLIDGCPKDKTTRKRKKASKAEAGKNQKINIDCSICLNNIRGNKIANPSGCRHNFCVACLKKWAKRSLTCPFDRTKFDFINILDKNTNEILQKVDKNGKPYKEQINTKTAVVNQVANDFNDQVRRGIQILPQTTPTQRQIVASRENHVINFNNQVRGEVLILPQLTQRQNLPSAENCFVCEHFQHQKLMVRCDSCNNQFHIDCLPNKEVTISQWSCFMCQALGKPSGPWKHGAMRNMALQRYRIHQQITNKNKMNKNKPDKTVRCTLSEPRNVQPLQPNHLKLESQDILFDIIRSQNELFGVKASSKNTSQMLSRSVPKVDSLLRKSEKTKNALGTLSPNSTMSLVSKVTRDIMNQYQNRVTNDKAKEIFKIVVPKLAKEVGSSTSLDRLKVIAEEKILTWMDIL